MGEVVLGEKNSKRSELYTSHSTKYPVINSKFITEISKSVLKVTL